MIRSTSQLTMEGGEIVVHRHGRIAQALMGDDCLSKARQETGDVTGCI